ncbi:hypothetical protein F2Q69_00060678 [Brassica cretica]|uniref:Uncharacterized protein n=1 Tax=Brassica cretica TaxID=69181 RepID=A0A8S9RFN7_BRACR|nr:hypothetical protein F2Q69_00060678 [Brassica cretica]
METVGYVVYGSPEIGEAYRVACGGVDEGGGAVVSLRGDKCGDVKGGISWEWQWVAFTVECGVCIAKTVSRMDWR